jgi:hypothetical protein
MVLGDRCPREVGPALIDRIGDDQASMGSKAAWNDVMILPYDANSGRMEFSERTAGAVSPRLRGQ